MRRNKSINLRSRIIIFLGLAILLIVAIFATIFREHIINYQKTLFSEESIKSLHLVDTSIEDIIVSADDYSKMMVADSLVQNQMVRGDIYYDTKNQNRLINRVYSVLQFSESVDAIWFVDLMGQKLTVGGVPTVSSHGNYESSFDEIRNAYGRPRVLVTSNNNIKSLSLVRSYNDTSKFTPVGIIGVDIKIDKIEQNIVAGAVKNNIKAKSTGLSSAFADVISLFTPTFC